ncbi:MAG: hypothetical protein K8F91_16205, partial [Candidatus Obscuribacterales bacterium]|nr:hypothetical protein [Candidatus Obscuribacterales bacterium]
MNHKNLSVPLEELHGGSSKLQAKPKRQKPDWLKVKLPTSKQYVQVKKLISDYGLNTVCESAACPNRGE